VDVLLLINKKNLVVSRAVHCVQVLLCCWRYLVVELTNLLALIKVPNWGDIWSKQVRISWDVRCSADSTVVCCLLANFLH